MALILLRHTRPLQAAGLCYGRTDLDLSDDFGVEAMRLAQELPTGFVRVVTSPLSRCARLAQVIAAQRDLPLTTDPRLTEIDFGAWEGVAWDAVPRAGLDAWAADMLHARPHGGETVAMLRDRAFGAFAHWAGQGGDSLLVTHHGVIKSARWLTDGDAAWQSTLDFGGWITLDRKVVPNA